MIYSVKELTKVQLLSRKKVGNFKEAELRVIRLEKHNILVTKILIMLTHLTSATIVQVDKTKKTYNKVLLYRLL